MKVRATVRVSGIVQGVLFRSNVRSVALGLGVKGWVRNTEDGRVEAVLEGNKEDVERVIEFCRKGPPGAVVDHTGVKHGEYVGRFRGFFIKH